MPASLRELPKKHFQTKLHSIFLRSVMTILVFPKLGGGGGVALGRILFVLPKNVVKIGAVPNAAPTSKIWRNLSVDQKDRRRRSVWVGHADFSKMTQRKQTFIKHVNCMFNELNFHFHFPIFHFPNELHWEN